MRRKRELHVWVPTNRVDAQCRYTHVDGWNELKKAYESNRNIGSSVMRENVKHVATHTRLAMMRQRWHPMTRANAQPCKVTLTFVERDRRRDVGNIHGGAKYALDALTARHKFGAGAIYDDSTKWLPEIEYRIAYVGKEWDEPGIAITVTTLEDR